MKKALLTAVLVYIIAPAIAQHSNQIAEPLFWYHWDSQTGFANKGSAQQATLLIDSNLIVDSAGINYNTSVHFNGNRIILKAKALILTKPKVTVMVVFIPDSLSATKHVYSLGKDSTVALALSPTSIERYARRMYFQDSVIVRPTINVLEGVVRNTGQGGLQLDLLIGDDEQDAFVGHIGELLLFNEKLSQSTRLKFETYLAIKYGVTLAGEGYMGTSDSMIWRKSQSDGFENDIIGIGREDELGLDQKQSKNNEIGIALNGFYTRNDLNPGHLPLGNYLLISATAADFEQMRFDTVAVDSFRLIFVKQWRATTFGDSIHLLPTTVQLDASRFYNRDSIYLRILRANALTEEVRLPDSIDQHGVVYYKNLYWNTSGQGNDAFSFGLKASLAVQSLVQNGGLRQDMEGGQMVPYAVIHEIEEQAAIAKGARKAVLSIKTYPNPSDGLINIVVNSNPSEQTMLRIMDVSGRLIFSEALFGSSEYLIEDVRLELGTYLIEVRSNQGTRYSKVFIY